MNDFRLSAREESAQLSRDLERGVIMWVTLSRGPVAADHDAEAVRLVLHAPLCQHRWDVVLVREAHTPPILWIQLEIHYLKYIEM